MDANEAGALQRGTQLGLLLRRLHGLVSANLMRDMKHQMQLGDLGFSQMAALHQLRACGQLSITQLAGRAQLGVPATSHLVEQLVQRGYALRLENPENRREKLVAISAGGQALLVELDQRAGQAYATVFAQAPPDALEAAERAIEALYVHLALDRPPPCAPDPAHTPDPPTLSKSIPTEEEPA